MFLKQVSVPARLFSVDRTRHLRSTSSSHNKHRRFECNVGYQSAKSFARGFIRDVKKVRPNFNVWCYSGYTLEELKNRNDETTNQALNEIDVLVDGRFVQEKKDPNLRFRGSSNQRILDVHKCIQENKIVQIAV